MTSSSLRAVAPAEPLYLTCSPMQIDVIGQLLIDGAANATIARRMYRGEDTIKTHLRRVFEKAQMSSRTELAIRILRGEIIILDEQGRRVRF